VPEKGQRDQPRTIRAGSCYPRVDVVLQSLPGVHYALIHASRSRHIQEPTAAFPSCLGIRVRDERRRQPPLQAPRRPQANDMRQGWTVILSLRTTRSARLGAREKNACPESLVPVPLGEAFGLPIREKPRVRPAVVAHGQRAMAQVDNLHHVRMTALPAESVIMVAPVRRLGSARRYLGPLRWTSYLIHDPLPSSFVRRGFGHLGQHRQLTQRHVGHVASSR